MSSTEGTSEGSFFLQHCCKTIWKVTLRVLPLTFKPVLQHIRLLEAAWILSSDWIELRGSHAIHGIHVTIKRSTNTCFAAKSRTTPYTATTWIVARQVWSVGGKTRNIALQLVLQHELYILLPVLLCLWNEIDKHRHHYYKEFSSLGITTASWELHCCVAFGKGHLSTNPSVLHCPAPDGRDCRRITTEPSLEVNGV